MHESKPVSGTAKLIIAVATGPLSILPADHTTTAQ